MENSCIKRRVIAVAVVCCFILLLAGVLIFFKKSSDGEKKQKAADEKRLAELKQDSLGSYYLNTPTEDGLTVCVWKVKAGASQGKILCGLLPRQLDKILDSEVYYASEYKNDIGAMGLGLGGFPPEDMKIILSTFNLPKEKISVIAWHNAADSAGYCAEPNAIEVSEVKELLLGDK